MSKELAAVEIRGIRVLTTKQIAEAYGTTEEKIRWNFKYNRDKYVSGKHFVIIEGAELRELKSKCEFHTLFKQAKSVCFWTEKGALLHAKSLNTAKAWEVYDYLVDYYFRPKEKNVMVVSEQPQNQQDVLAQALLEANALLKERDERIKRLEGREKCLNQSNTRPVSETKEALVREIEKITNPFIIRQLWLTTKNIQR